MPLVYNSLAFRLLHEQSLEKRKDARSSLFAGAIYRNKETNYSGKWLPRIVLI